MRHIAEERLEDYARQDCHVPAGSFEEVREHVAACPMCQDRLSEMNEFLAFVQEAPCDTEGQIRSRHETAKGTVFLVVTGADATWWEARVIGPELDLLAEFSRGAAAKSHLEEWFAGTLPDHRCGHGCSAWK